MSGRSGDAKARRCGMRNTAFAPGAEVNRLLAIVVVI